MTRFAQLRFAAEVVQFKNQFRIGSSRFGHSILASLPGQSLARLDLKT
jgi:hypothetical protein